MAALCRRRRSRESGHCGVPSLSIRPRRRDAVGSTSRVCRHWRSRHLIEAGGLCFGLSRQCAERKSVKIKQNRGRRPIPLSPKPVGRDQRERGFRERGNWGPATGERSDWRNVATAKATAPTKGRGHGALAGARPQQSNDKDKTSGRWNRAAARTKPEKATDAHRHRRTAATPRGGQQTPSVARAGAQSPAEGLKNIPRALPVAHRQKATRDGVSPHAGWAGGRRPRGDSRATERAGAQPAETLAPL